jgi:hypothetical protein
MGLDVSHGAWHGAYSAFMDWRVKLAEVAGLPPLLLMDGFFLQGDILWDPFIEEARKFPATTQARYYNSLPIKWEILPPNPLYELLYHSDCGGEIDHDKCLDIALALEKLLPLLPDEDVGGHIGNWRDKTQTFIEGLLLAAEREEDLEFS